MEVCHEVNTDWRLPTEFCVRPLVEPHRDQGNNDRLPLGELVISFFSLKDLFEGLLAGSLRQLGSQRHLRTCAQP